MDVAPFKITIKWSNIIDTLSTLTILCTESLSGVFRPSTQPGICKSGKIKRRTEAKTAISPKTAWNRYKQPSAKLWPWTAQAIDLQINSFNCFSWARLRLGSIKHTSISSPCLCWWQRLIRKSKLSWFPVGAAALPSHFHIFPCSSAACESFSQTKIMLAHNNEVCMKTADACLHTEACRFTLALPRLIMQLMISDRGAERVKGTWRQR